MNSIVLKGGLGNDHYHITPGHSQCIDIGGFDTYVIHRGSLMQGGTATIQDSDGWGQLIFDATYLHATPIVAISDTQWQFQGQQSIGKLTRQGSDLHIAAQGYTGNVVVEGFFNANTFLGLTLPKYDPQALFNPLALHMNNSATWVEDELYAMPVEQEFAVRLLGITQEPEWDGIF